MTGYGGRILRVDLGTGRSDVRAARRDDRAGVPRRQRPGRAAPVGDGAGRPPIPTTRRTASPSAWGRSPTRWCRGTAGPASQSKSPLTGLFFDSTFGGRFPATLKRTGFDAVLVTGAAPPIPSTSWSPKPGRRLKDARPLWGRDHARDGRGHPGGRGRRRRRAGHRPGRRAPGTLRVPRPLLEEPRGRGGPRRPSARSAGRRTSRRSARPGYPEDRPSPIRRVSRS